MPQSPRRRGPPALAVHARHAPLEHRGPARPARGLCSGALRCGAVRRFGVLERCGAFCSAGCTRPRGCTPTPVSHTPDQQRLHKLRRPRATALPVQVPQRDDRSVQKRSTALCLLEEALALLHASPPLGAPVIGELRRNRLSAPLSLPQENVHVSGLPAAGPRGFRWEWTETVVRWPT